MDFKFVRNLNGIRHPKIFYATYGVSYFVSNASASIIVLQSFIKGASQDLFVLIVPFTFLLFTKLYNNEYSRYKDYVKRKANGTWSGGELPCSVASLYYFQYMAVVMSLLCFVLLHAHAMHKYVDSMTRADVVVVAIQMGFAMIIFMNGIVLLCVLSDDDNAKDDENEASCSVVNDNSYGSADYTSPVRFGIINHAE